MPLQPVGVVAKTRSLRLHAFDGVLQHELPDDARAYAEDVQREAKEGDEVREDLEAGVVLLSCPVDDLRLHGADESTL